MTDNLEYNAWLRVWEHPAFSLTETYRGSFTASVVVVGQGSGVPFGDKYGTEFAYNSLGDVAFEVGWANMQQLDPQSLRDKNGIIICGKRAAKWIKYYVDGGVDALELPVPIYLLTRLSADERQVVYEQVRAFVENHI